MIQAGLMMQQTNEAYEANKLAYDVGSVLQANIRKACEIGSKYTKVESKKNQLQQDLEVKTNDFDALAKTLDDKDRVLPELKERFEAAEKNISNIEFFPDFEKETHEEEPYLDPTKSPVPDSMVVDMLCLNARLLKGKVRDVEVTFSKRNATVYFFIMEPNKGNIVLGRDFLRAMRGFIDVGHMEARCNLTNDEKKLRYSKDKRVCVVHFDDPHAWFLSGKMGKPRLAQVASSPWRAPMPSSSSEDNIPVKPVEMRMVEKDNQNTVSVATNFFKELYEADGKVEPEALLDLFDDKVSRQMNDALYEAEDQALYFGLYQARNLNFNKVQIKTNCSTVVAAANGSNVNRASWWACYENSKVMIKEFGDCFVSKVHRESNMVALELPAYARVNGDLFLLADVPQALKHVIDLGLEVINPIIEPGEVLPNVIGINLVLVGELRDHHVVGVESTLHHPLALEDLLFHYFEPRLHASGLLGPLNIEDVQHPITHLDRLRLLQHSR
ncbi:DNA-directed RNA polymerase subunit beta [Hordeum vulgare]|nr:DNA-directed RNA polymerase subunit beta [Hordeum vulgare]